jgi:hypothetical protein
MRENSIFPKQHLRKSASKTILSLTLLSLISIMAASGVGMVAAQTNWISVNSIYDLTDNIAVSLDQPLVSGHSYNLTMSVNVPFTQAQSEFQLTLSDKMSQKATQFWYLDSTYAGYDAQKFNGGLRTITFNQVQGTAILTVVFMVPQGFTLTSAGSLSLHAIKSNTNIVSIQVTGGANVGSFSSNISDESIQQYLAAYSTKSTYISQGKIDSSYTNLVDGILQQAQSIYQIGLPDNAKSILNNIDTAYFPAPPNNSMSMILIVAVVAIAIIAGIAAVLFLRTRTRLQYVMNGVNDVQKELASLEVSAAQSDARLAERITNIKKRLGEIFE